MRYLARIITAVSAAALVALGAASIASAQQASLSEEQKASIRANCSEVKTNLNQLHASDALLRVNRGQAYESLASKLMERFNARLNNNRLDAKAMETVTANYRKKLSEFREHYITYEQRLSEALRIDCNAEPEKFYQAVAQAREDRKRVHADITALHTHIDDYRRSVGDFLLNYERVSQ